MGEKRQVLLADDNRLVVKVTSAILEQAGYTVEVARDGIEAAVKAFSLLPDLMILDVEMPKIRGYQVCRLLKEDPLTSWMPVIMLTGREHHSDMFWGLKVGADAYITKGFKPEHLLQKVEELFSRAGEYEAERELSRKRKKDVTADYIIDKITDLLDRKLYETTILNDIASLSVSLQDFTETVNSVFEILNILLNCTMGSLLFLSEREMYMCINHPCSADRLEELAQETLGAATGYVRRESDLALIERIVLNRERLTEALEDRQARQEYIQIPLTAHKNVIGVLVAAGPATPAFRRDAPATLNLVSKELTMILDNARLYEGAKRMAITDGLTKIYNHRFFQELFEKEYKRSARYKTTFSLIMLDIDFFKQVNDTYGHLYGDEILKDMANLVKGCLRSMDILARYGGEEFAVLLPETDLEEALFTAERIRMAVENHDFPHPNGKPVKVTVSQGVTSFPSPDIEKRSDIVAKADAALYEAKEAGRNRVCRRE